MNSLQTTAGRRAALLYNPVARTLARHRDLIPRVADLLARQNIDCRLIPTVSPGSATEQVKEQIAEGCNLIIAAGGDGTINEIADGMLYTGVPLAVVPCGTANVLARELHLPANPEKAAGLVSNLEPHSITIGSLRTSETVHRTFICMAGIGLDADVISRLNLDFKAAAGKLAYYVSGFAQIWRTLPEFDVDVDGRCYRASFALISRVRNYGGDLEIARGASLLRNDFEIVLFRGSLALHYVPYLLGVALKKVHRIHGCQVLHGRNVTCHPVSGKTVYAQVDGELAGAVPVSAELIPGALTLLAPPEFAIREQALAAAVPTYA